MPTLVTSSLSVLSPLRPVKVAPLPPLYVPSLPFPERPVYPDDKAGEPAISDLTVMPDKGGPPATPVVSPCLFRWDQFCLTKQMALVAAGAVALILLLKR